MNALSPQQGLLQSPPSLAEPNRVISTAPCGLGCGGQSSHDGQMNRHARGQATSLSVAGRRNVRRNDGYVHSCYREDAFDSL